MASAQRDAAENDFALKREGFGELIGGAEFELGLLPRTAPDPPMIVEPLSLLIEEALERNAISYLAGASMQSGKTNAIGS